MEQIKRPRGGQKGNRNALKHGYYSRIFNGKEKRDYCSAADVQGIDEEIALIRHVIKVAAAAKDDEHLAILVRATNALNRLIRTRHSFTGRYDQLNEAISNVVEEVLVPLGVDLGQIIIGRKTPENGILDTPRNEAELPQ